MFDSLVAKMFVWGRVRKRKQKIKVTRKIKKDIYRESETQAESDKLI